MDAEESTYFHIQGMARKKGLSHKTEASQRIWGTRLHFKVINITMMFLKEPLENWVRARNSIYLNQCFKKYCLQIDILLILPKFISGEISFRILDCESRWNRETFNLKLS